MSAIKHKACPWGWDIKDKGSKEWEKSRTPLKEQKRADNRWTVDESQPNKIKGWTIVSTQRTLCPLEKENILMCLEYKIYVP